MLLKKKIWDFKRKRNYFHLIYLDTPTKMRFTNFCKKHYEISLEKFIELDDFLYTKTQLHACIQEANFRIINHSTLKELYEFVEKNRASIERPFRPSWDEYFMKIAYAVKARSNCMKRSVGAVIMKNKRIISTGYNGTPSVYPNCYQKGCQRCNNNAKQGVDLHKCMCIHAEGSAILEAKISVMKGATIYTTLFPCSFCAKIIKHTQISRVVYDEEFDDKNSRKILVDGGIEICQLSVSQYLFNI